MVLFVFRCIAQKIGGVFEYRVQAFEICFYEAFAAFRFRYGRFEELDICQILVDAQREDRYRLSIPRQSGVRLGGSGRQLFELRFH